MTTRFTSPELVALYAAHRPDYPSALFSWLGETLRRGADAVVVDVGAGTGIFARQLRAKLGVGVVPVEPSAEMRARMGGEDWGTRWGVLDGTAERLGLPDATADAVVAAQAAHWFQLQRALFEARRVAKPGATCVFLWNDRVKTGFAGAMDEVFWKHSHEFRSLRRIEETMRDLRKLVPAGQEKTFPHKQTLDLKGVLGRAWSTSYIRLGVAPENAPAFDRDLTAVFRTWEDPVTHTVDIDYETVVFYWSSGDAIRLTSFV